MAKRIVLRPDWLNTQKVEAILSVSSCVSDDFADWINYWKHNGYWFFDSPSVIRELAHDNTIDLTDTRWFYFEGYEQEYDEGKTQWSDYEPEHDFETSVLSPLNPRLLGYDIATFSSGASVECSPISCNHLAENLDVNRHCLLDTFNEARALIESGGLSGCEPGPYRMISVSEVTAPTINVALVSSMKCNVR